MKSEDYLTRKRGCLEVCFSKGFPSFQPRVKFVESSLCLINNETKKISETGKFLSHQ